MRRMGEDEAVENAPLWPSDITPLCERIANRKARAGATHPVAAALAYCARAHTRMSPAAFAATVGLRQADVEALEAGDVAWEDVPDRVSEIAAAPGVNFLALADLNDQFAHVA